MSFHSKCKRTLASLSVSVHLKPSLQLTIILSVAHFLAVGLLWPLMLPVSYKLLLFIALGVSMIFYLRQYALLTSLNSIVAFELSETMQCSLETRGGLRFPCEILGSTFVAPYLAVVNLKLQNKIFSRSVVILPDSIDGEEFRKLRVLLRWKWKATKDNF